MIELFVLDIQDSLKNRCYFAALALALTLPDICGAAEYPTETSVGKRYINWYNKYIGDFERKARGSDDDSYLSGEAVYNLRNTFLHQGNPTINKDKVKAPENRFDKFILILGDGTKIWELIAQFNFANGAAKYRAIIIDITYLCQKICNAALFFDSQQNDKILKDILVIPQEYLMQPENPEAKKPDYSSFAQLMNQQLHQNGVNVSFPESYFSGFISRSIDLTAQSVFTQTQLEKYLNEKSQSIISDEEKCKIITIVMNANSKQEVHNKLQKAFGNDKAKEYYSMLKPIIKNNPGK